MEAIADDVCGATTSLVEHVLERYGDPGDPPDVDTASEPGDDGQTSPVYADELTDTDEGEDELTDPESPNTSTLMSDDSTIAETEPTIDPSSLTKKQAATLEEIYRTPDVTQATLADRFGVTSATISQRLNSIDGFDWSRRRQQVRALVDRGHLDAERDDTEVDQETEIGGDGIAGVEDDTEIDGNDTEADEHTEIESQDVASAAREAGVVIEEETDSERGDQSDNRSDHKSRMESETRTQTGTSASDSMRPTDLTDREKSANGGREFESHESVNSRVDSADAVAERDESISRESDAERSIADLTAQVESLNRRVRTLERDEKSVDTEPIFDPELTHKIIHACIDADHVSEDEELQIIKGILADAGGG